jgi:glycosyltransferase involved in cell wall biosynthesis
MEKLISVIIPCFNVEEWLREAIDSCLQQSYPKIEIIVIDDGSTDNCLEILKSYEDKIIWETGLNRGGNYARNRGFALSKGEYIQFLDADDYILPEKIERQVDFLEKTGADVVYGDLKYKRHLPDGTSLIEDRPEKFTQVKEEDILESLLADRWWVVPAALLFRRKVVETSGGWDENLKAGQDRDFLISVAMNGAKILYQSGCYSFYRQYGNTTVSTSNRVLWLQSHILILEKAEMKLNQSGKLSSKYRKALAQGYASKKRFYFLYFSHYQYLRILKKILSLDPTFKVDKNRKSYFLQIIFGFLLTELFLKIMFQLRKELKIFDLKLEFLKNESTTY